MDSPPTTVALIGRPSDGTCTLFHRLTGRPYTLRRLSSLDSWTASSGTARCDPSGSLPETGIYSYMEQKYRLTFCPAVLSSFDIILVAVNASYLEDGLARLADVIADPAVKDFSRPVVLCIMGLEAAEQAGILIDFDLLEDVLQIPVVSLHRRSAEDPDDVKAAVAYAGTHRVSYDCLDFSPKNLAEETLHRIRYPALPHPSTLQIDRILLGPVTGPLLLIVILLLLFWLTVSASRLLQAPLCQSLLWLEQQLTAGLLFFHAPDEWTRLLVCGLLRPLSCMLAILLPPLLLFIPGFSLLEELEYLPRAAYLADRMMRTFGGCGCQCMAMAAGLCCPHAGIMESKKITSPRERITAVVAAAFLPGSARIAALFPLTGLLVSDLFHGAAGTAVLAVILLIGLTVSLCFSLLLSGTLFRRLPSAFVLELPPYHRIRIRSVLLPVIVNRLSLLLGRAAAFTIPAGLTVWLLSQIRTGSLPLLACCIDLLAFPARICGLDGAALAALILGIPANELILPLLFAAYTPFSGFPSLTILPEANSILAQQGWTWQTACSAILLTLFSCPPLSALSLIRQETNRLRWTMAAALIPPACGIGLCALLTACVHLVGQ